MRWPLETRQHWGASLFNRVFSRYLNLFGAYSFALRRRHEYDADLCAAETTTAQTAADALIREAVYRSYLYRKFWLEISERVRSESSPPPVYTEMRKALRGELQPDEAQRWLDEAMQMKTLPRDVHPPLKDRLRALGQTPRLPLPIDESAADVYLSNYLDELTERLNVAYQESEREEWQAEYEDLQNASEESSEQDLKAMQQDFTDQPARSVVAKQKSVRRAVKQFEVNQNSRAERGDVSFLDQFSSHDLPDEKLEHLRQALASDARVREAYLVRKEVKYLPAEPFYALGVVVERPWHKQFARNWSFTRQFPYKLETPLPLYSFELDNNHQRVRKNLRVVPNSLIYQRTNTHR